MTDFNYDQFWKLYHVEGIHACLNYAKSFVKDDEGYDKLLQEHVPGLVEAAKGLNSISMIDFLKDLDEVEAEMQEIEDARGTDSDVGGISPDSDHEADPTTDADDAAEERADAQSSEAESEVSSSSTES